MLVAYPTTFERVASTLLRVFKPRSAETSEGALTELYAAHMFEEGNFLHRHIIRRITPHIRLDETNLDAIRLKVGQGTFVYVTIDLGQLEFNVFNAICLKQKFPLAVFNNFLRVRRWLPFRRIRQSYKQRIQFIKKYEKFPDPILSGYLQSLLLAGKSPLLSLDSTDAGYLSAPMRDLLNVLVQSRKASEKPIFVIPQQLIWDRRPRRQRTSLFEAFFGESDYPGKWRKMILFFRHFRRQAVVRFGEPVPLTDFLETAGEDPELSLYQKILSSLRIEKRGLIGPLIRTRSWFIERIFEDEALSRTIYEIAKEKNKPVASVKRLAHRYAKEIAADFRQPYLEFSNAWVDFIIRHLFEGIFIDNEGLKNLKKILNKGPTILVPNHRSHLDYLLMGHICYQNDIVSPLVAAGINLAFWPLGFYFRRNGAFFIRRTFGGNRLYKQVVQNYLRVLVQEGYLQEFFIEGGRSRTGKLRNPRLGMLSMYSDVMAEHAASDIHFVPVSITYDRVLEQKSYLAEVEGAPKKKEKTRDLFKLTRFLKGRYGKIYVHFDEPISWQQETSQTPDAEWEAKKPKIVEHLSQRICHAINRQVVVVPQALAASSLLNTSWPGITEEKVGGGFRELLHYLRSKPYIRLSETLLKNPEGAFQEAVHQFESAGLIKRHEGLDRTFYEIPFNKRLELDFFKNVTIHYFVSLALWSNLLLAQNRDTFPLSSLAGDYAYFQKLFFYEFRFSTRLPLSQHLDKLCCYLQEKKRIEYHDGEIRVLREGRPFLKDYSILLRNYIEAYSVAWRTYLLKPTLPFDEKNLIKAMLTCGKHQLMLGIIESPEAVSKDIFENAIQSFKELGLFEVESREAGRLESELKKLLSVFK